MNAKLYKTEKENYVLVDPTKGTYDDGYMLGTSRESQYNKLSIKNCQAIEQDSPLQEYVLEVNGEGWDDHLYRGSRKQTEWEVEVEKENVMHDYNGNISLGAKFKLDADGCLILKLKSE